MEKRKMKTPILETERLLLRSFSMDDAQAVFHGWENDPDVAKYMFWTSHNEIKKTIEWLIFETGKADADDWYRWAFVRKDTGELIGTGLIYLEEEYNKYEISYNLSKKAWGNGYTTEAMKEIIRFAAEELNIKEIVGRHAIENPASKNVMTKLGFQFVKNIPYECNGGTKTYEGKEYIWKRQ